MKHLLNQNIQAGQEALNVSKASQVILVNWLADWQIAVLSKDWIVLDTSVS